MTTYAPPMDELVTKDSDVHIPMQTRSHSNRDFDVRGMWPRV